MQKILYTVEGPFDDEVNIMIILPKEIKCIFVTDSSQRTQRAADEATRVEPSVWADVL